MGQTDKNGLSSPFCDCEEGVELAELWERAHKDFSAEGRAFGGGGVEGVHGGGREGWWDSTVKESRDGSIRVTYWCK